MNLIVENEKPVITYEIQYYAFVSITLLLK
ncbi:hypothetical protein SRABI04_01812 [Chryseobacterium sp. Bi04]|jgi:hypothetical protein|nr:hypothetical protein SRABI04_01812 [Chryseobacterium sp. Bi04]